MTMICALGLLATTNAQTANPSSKYGVITGRVMCEDGPVPFASVTVSAASGRDRGSSTRNLTSDGEGNFKADGLPAAAYIVTANSPGYVPESASLLPSEGLANQTDPPAPTYYRIGDTVTIRLIKGGVIRRRGKRRGADGRPWRLSNIRPRRRQLPGLRQSHVRLRRPVRKPVRSPVRRTVPRQAAEPICRERSRLSPLWQPRHGSRSGGQLRSRKRRHRYPISPDQGLLDQRCGRGLRTGLHCRHAHRQAIGSGSQHCLRRSTRRPGPGRPRRTASRNSLSRESPMANTSFQPREARRKTLSPPPPSKSPSAEPMLPALF
ncbi:MAG: carboxypeptidase regulatory-like domain-containing protein [Acidobacteria bacterium]|nr:carboxypeptidase regulatory-like domain-containing protein [Acidobacteriota bacterium]